MSLCSVHRPKHITRTQVWRPRNQTVHNRQLCSLNRCLGPLVNKILTNFHHHAKPPTGLGASSSTSEYTANSTNSKPNIDHQKLRNGYLPEKGPNFNQVPPPRSGGRRPRTARQGRPENTHRTQCTEATACAGRRPTHSRPHVISGRSCRALGQTPHSSPPSRAISAGCTAQRRCAFPVVDSFEF